MSGLQKKRRVEVAGASSQRHPNPPSPKDTWKRLDESTPGRLWSLELRDGLRCDFVDDVRSSYRDSLRFMVSNMFLADPAGRNSRGCEALLGSGVGVMSGSSVIVSEL